MRPIEKPKIIFDKDSLPFILEALGKTIKDKVIIDKITGDPVLTKIGETVTVDNLVGIQRNNWVVKNWVIIQEDKVGIL